MINKYEINKINAKLRLSSSKEANKHKNRKAQLQKYGNFLWSNLRRLNRLSKRQSLLSYFLLKQMDQYRKFNLNDDSILDSYTYERSEELFHSVFGSKQGQSAKKQLKKPKAQNVKPKTNVQANLGMRKSAVERTSVKDEL